MKPLAVALLAFYFFGCVTSKSALQNSNKEQLKLAAAASNWEKAGK